MKQRRIKLLVLCPDEPFPVRAGGQMRMAPLIEIMAEFADLTVAYKSVDRLAATVDWANRMGIRLANFPISSPNLTRQWSDRFRRIVTCCNMRSVPDEKEFFDQVYREFSPDCVWLETPYLFLYARAWQHRVPVVVDYWGTSQGAERIFRYARGWRKLPTWLNWATAREAERRFAPEIKHIVCISTVDARYFRSMAPESSVTVIPPCMLTDAVARKNRIKKIRSFERRLMLTGDMSYQPNVDAADYFAAEIWPLIRRRIQGVEFHIVGRCPTPKIQRLAKIPGIVVTGEVPDLSEEIKTCSIYVLPMRLGSGIRSKLFEVFPHEKAIVTTSVGAEGLALRNGEHCLIADDKQRFADACIKLLNDEKQRIRLGEAACRLAMHIYSRRHVNDLLLETIQRIFETGYGRLGYGEQPLINWKPVWKSTSGSRVSPK